MLASSTSTSNNESIDFVVPIAGTYYIKVYGSNMANQYNIWWDDVFILNEPPELDWKGGTNYYDDGLDPEIGYPINFYYYGIKYIDLDGDPPGYVHVHIKKGGVEFSSSPHTMTCASGDYTTGVNCSYTKMGMVYGSDFTYYFTAQDNLGAAAEPTQELDAPDVCAMDAKILIVDDDSDWPNVRQYYIDALESLGEPYYIWDTGYDGSTEPTAVDLEWYEKVIWASGRFVDWNSGPGPSGETALGQWLDSGQRCLFISSQDYLFGTGITTFMESYLGVDSAEQDVSQTIVTGVGSVFSGLGPYSLNYPFFNGSDRISPDSTAELAFSGDQGDAAVSKSTGLYKTSFWGFPFEAISSAADRQESMAAFLDWCDIKPGIYLPLVLK